jgi:hypothetical protein
MGQREYHVRWLINGTQSVFENSDMMATGQPGPEEISLLEPFRGKVPNCGRLRLRAVALLVGAVIAVSCAFLPDLVLAQGNPPPAAAIATPIGKIVTAKGWVKVEHSVGGSAQARVGDLVYEGDVVSTGADGAVGIIFSDGGTFNLASNLSMVTSNLSLFRLTTTRPKSVGPPNPHHWIERLSDEELRAPADGKLDIESDRRGEPSRSGN